MIGQDSDTVSVEIQKSYITNDNIVNTYIHDDSNKDIVTDKNPVKQYRPNSPEWLVQRIKKDSNERAITLLRI